MNNPTKKQIAIIGGGPAGLMAAQEAAKWGKAAGLQVDVYDAMPSVGRKFLLAGKGGLDLTHSDPADRFAERYGARRSAIEALLQAQYLRAQHLLQEHSAVFLRITQGLTEHGEVPKQDRKSVV